VFTRIGHRTDVEGKFVMRLAFSIALAAAALLASVDARAQTYDPRFPVCLHVYSTGGHGGFDYFNCSVTSIPQCRATASGISASCDLNPYYAFDQPRPPVHRRSRKPVY
jgi:hypothetical protein